MRGVIWVAFPAIAALAGGAAATMFPSEQIGQTTRQLAEQIERNPVVELNPLAWAYDTVKAKIQRGVTPTELGIPASPPFNFTMPDAKAWQGIGSTTLNPAFTDGWARTVATQPMQFNDRMENLRNYAHNPGGWHGAPPF
jgi:hypothetical protein